MDRPEAVLGGLHPKAVDMGDALRQKPQQRLRNVTEVVRTSAGTFSSVGLVHRGGQNDRCRKAVGNFLRETFGDATVHKAHVHLCGIPLLSAVLRYVDLASVRAPVDRVNDRKTTELVQTPAPMDPGRAPGRISFQRVLPALAKTSLERR